MKTVKEYLKDFIKEPNFEEVEELIKQVQIDAIEHTVKRCAEDRWKPIVNVDELPKESVMEDGHWISEFLVKNNNQMGNLQLISTPDVHGNFLNKGEYVYKHHLESNCEYMELTKQSIHNVANKIKEELK